jgi:hypothetical protein
MQNLLVGLATLLTSLSVFAKSEMGEIRAEDFPKKVREQLVLEKQKNNCARQFFKTFSQTGSGLARVKLEWLADVMCDNQVFFWHYLSAYFNIQKFRPVIGIPLLLSFQGIPEFDLEQVSLLINNFFIPGEFSLKNANIYDLNVATITRDGKTVAVTPDGLESGRQNIFNLDVDRWIEEREANHRGELMQWMGSLIRERETLTVVKVASKYDAVYYKEHGHPEASLFLSYFKPIHFNGHFTGDKPRARSCQEEL